MDNVRGGTAWVAFAALLFALSGCTGSGAFKAGATMPLIIEGYGYGGAQVRAAEGRLDVNLNDGTNQGTVRATIQDTIQGFEVRFVNFSERQPYQSGGVARNLWMWGSTGNGSTVFPKILVHAAAFGRAAYYEDGQLQRDPTSLAEDFQAYLFVTRGQYRDGASYAVRSANQEQVYDPARPDDAYVSQIGSQAVILLYQSKGQLHQHFEFRDVRITAG